jgi:hypothetical protein
MILYRYFRVTVEMVDRGGGSALRFLSKPLRATCQVSIVLLTMKLKGKSEPTCLVVAVAQGQVIDRSAACSSASRKILFLAAIRLC